MQTGIYKFADHPVKICSVYPDVHTLCEDYRFDGAPEFEIATTLQDIQNEARISAEEDRVEGLPVHTFPEGYLETLAVYRKLADVLIHKDVLLFHGSVIAVDGHAYLFTAKSGTGKSTHTRLWREMFGDRAVMVNDDKPLLAIKDGRIIAYGTPWNGKHKLGCNMSAPLSAICVLERGQTNKIFPLQPSQALPMLLQQSHRPADAAGRLAYLENLDKIAGATRFFRLECNMDPEAAKVAYEGMKL